MLKCITWPGCSREALVVFVIVVGGCLMPLVAHAGYKIYSPEVESGETELEFRGYYNQDDTSAADDSGAYVFGAGHALTSFWFSEIYAEFEYSDGEGTELEAIEWENRFQLTEEEETWASFGLLTEVAFSVHGEPHEFKIGPLIEKSFGRTVATVNLFLEREFGSDASDETEFSYAARLLYHLTPQFSPAIEIYGSPGPVDDFEPSDEQRHQIGPAVYGGIPVGDGDEQIEYSAAALAGLTDEGSPDWTFVLRFEYAFE